MLPSWPARDVSELIGVVFSGLSPLVIEEVAGELDGIRVRARTPGGPVPCPGRGVVSERVYA